MRSICSPDYQVSEKSHFLGDDLIRTWTKSNSNRFSGSPASHDRCLDMYLDLVPCNEKGLGFGAPPYPQ